MRAATGGEKMSCTITSVTCLTDRCMKSGLLTFFFHSPLFDEQENKARMIKTKAKIFFMMLHRGQKFNIKIKNEANVINLPLVTVSTDHKLLRLFEFNKLNCVIGSGECQIILAITF